MLYARVEDLKTMVLTFVRKKYNRARRERSLYQGARGTHYYVTHDPPNATQEKDQQK